MENNNIITTENETVLRIEDMTPDNYMQYLQFFFGPDLTGGKRDNVTIILEAGFASGVYGYEELKNYLTFGTIPNYHTFAAWKQAGYIVKKGQKAAFKADIWKYVEKKGTMTEEEAERLNSIMTGPNGEPLHKAGDETTSSRYIKKLSFFFGPDQVEKIA